MAQLEGNGFFQFVRNVHQFPTMLITLKWLWGNKYGKILRKLILYIICTLYIHTLYLQTDSSGRASSCWKHGCIYRDSRLLFVAMQKQPRQTPKWPIGPFQSMCFKPGRTEKELLGVWLLVLSLNLETETSKHGWWLHGLNRSLLIFFYFKVCPKKIITMHPNFC